MNRKTTATGDPAANLILAALPGEDFARWLPHLEPVDLRVGEVLHEAGRTPRWAYFPVTAAVSLLVPTRDGRGDEVCVVGCEGMLGLALFLSGGASTNRAVVQSAGRAFRVPPAWIQEEFARSPAIMRLLLRYTMARSTELAQNVVCSRHHTTAQRLCRRLLQAVDRQDGGNIVTTQEQLAGLLGVRRESITSAALELQRAGVIRYTRGQIKVLDRAGLARHSCECYVLARNIYQRLAPSAAASEVGREAGEAGPGPRERSRGLASVLGQGLLATALTAGAAAQVQPAAPPTRGELLYNNHCIECHTTRMHWRDRRQARDWPSLRAQVERWQAAAGLQWSEADITDVARHLDNTIYRFTPDTERVGSATAP